jgi:predicted Zn finger-like uncharacterized protein
MQSKSTQTRCPHCDTQFRVTESQVNTANGYVRCGVCKEVFNAFEVATQEKAAETETHVDFNETPATDKSRKDAFDFFDEEANDSLQHVVPDELRDQYGQQSNLLSSLLWSAGILLLIGSLFVEYLWFNRQQLNQVAELKPMIEILCQIGDCNTITDRDPAKIKLITRNVYSHPKHKDALMIAVTMKNNAAFDQIFPVMQIRFSNVRGGVIAARQFTPAEYLQLSPDNQQTLNAGRSIDFQLEIKDPGEQAKTYEFDFL